MSASDGGDGTTESTPWHAGERAVQAQVGVAERMAGVGRRTIRPFMPDQHRAFFAQLPFLVLGSVDAEGWVWASILSGTPGFATSPDPRTLSIAARPAIGDPLAAALVPGAPIGVLGIELPTRRRNRANGRVIAADADGFSLAVDQSFGNCPQYIQRRDYLDDRSPAPAEPRIESFTALDAAARTLITASDTCFVASFAATDGPEASRGVDISHRGGRSGFIGIAGDGAIVVPDYPGNLYFNTLGNLTANPRAGLLFVDFASGDLLQIAGTTEIVWSGPKVRAFAGAERLWRVTPSHGRWLRGALKLRFALREFSPNSLVTGTWQQAQETLEAERLRNVWRPFRIAQVIDESADVRSFHLEPADGLGVPAFRAGQHLPIRLAIPGRAAPLTRPYTISSAPGAGLRITVKRLRAPGPETADGVASSFLHALAPGAVIEALAPRGAFIFDATVPRPAVLLSAGIGVTPMIAMLRHAVNERVRTRRMRPIVFIHSARNAGERPFRRELQLLAEKGEGEVAIVFVATAPSPGETTGVDHHATGRLTIGHLKRLLPFDDYDFYLCGPGGFMQDLYDGLRDLNVADDRIHAEAFGPSTVNRRAPQTAPTAESESGPGTRVRFATAGIDAIWRPAQGNLLTLAEQSGLRPAHSCRAGSCGSCATRLLAGNVDYLQPPIAPVADGEALLCIARPRMAEGDDGPAIVIDL